MSDAIHNWSARRSGGRITITGERHKPYADGSFDRQPIKVTGIDAIVLEGEQIVAIDLDGNEHELARTWAA